VLMEYKLSDNHPDGFNLDFLMYDWRDNGELEDIKATPLPYQTPDNPRALLEFGVYRGSSRIINWQELFIDD